MNSSLRMCVVGLTVIFPACVILSAAPVAAGDCSYLVANHSYANQFNGFINAPMYFGPYAPPGVGMAPNAGAGTITFLGNGTAKNVETLAVGAIGLFKNVEISGPYSLTWDTTRTPVVCTGTLKMTGMMNGAPVEDDFQLVVSADGQKIEMIHTNPGLIVGATDLPMDVNGCRNSTIGATYVYNAHGWALAAEDPKTPNTLAGYIPFAMSGVMRFYPGLAPPAEFTDAPPGSALVQSWDSPSLGGQILPRTQTGWYKVDGQCRGTLFLRDSLGNQFHLQMFIGKDGKALFLTNIDVAPDMYKPAYPLGMTLDRITSPSAMNP